MRWISPMEYQLTALSVHWYQSYHWYQWTNGIPPYSYLIHCENILSPLNEMHFTNGVLTDCQASPLESVRVYWTTLSITYQTLSPTRRTFVFLGSRWTRPLSPGNAHALRCEFSKWWTSQGNKKKTSDIAMNSQHTPPLERRIHGKKIQNCMILRSRRLTKPTRN